MHQGPSLQPRWRPPWHLQQRHFHWLAQQVRIGSALCFLPAAETGSGSGCCAARIDSEMHYLSLVPTRARCERLGAGLGERLQVGRRSMRRKRMHRLRAGHADPAGWVLAAAAEFVERENWCHSTMSPAAAGLRHQKVRDYRSFADQACFGKERGCCWRSCLHPVLAAGSGFESADHCCH